MTQLPDARADQSAEMGTNVSVQFTITCDYHQPYWATESVRFSNSGRINVKLPLGGDIGSTLQLQFPSLEVNHNQETGCSTKPKITLTPIGGPQPGLTVRNFQEYDADPLLWTK